MDDRVRKMRRVIRDAVRDDYPGAVIPINGDRHASRTRRVGRALRVLGAVALLSWLPLSSGLRPAPPSGGSVAPLAAAKLPVYSHGVFKYSSGVWDPSRYVVEGILADTPTGPGDSTSPKFREADAAVQVL